MYNDCNVLNSVFKAVDGWIIDNKARTLASLGQGALQCLLFIRDIA